MSSVEVFSILPVAKIWETNNGRLDHPTLTLFGEKGNMGWILATAFGVLVMLVFTAFLVAVARRYRPEKAEATKPVPPAKPAA